MKKILILALSIIMTVSAVSLAGCGNDDNSAPQKSNTEATSASEGQSSTTATASSPSSTTEATTVAPSTAATEPTVSTAPTNAQNTNTQAANNGNRSSGNVAVTSVSLSKTSMTIIEGGSQSFEVYLNPDNATDKQYTVVTSNGNATVGCNGSSVTVYAQNKGDCTITVSSANGKSAVCQVTVTANTAYYSGGNSNSAGQSNNVNANTNSNAPLTDDTLLTHAQLCSESIVNRLMEKVNSIYQQKGMKYNPSLNKDNSGWLISGTYLYQGDYLYSVNSFIAKELAGYAEEIPAVILYDGSQYSDCQFHCYAEKQGDGEYYFYFCYG